MRERSTRGRAGNEPRPVRDRREEERSRARHHEGYRKETDQGQSHSGALREDDGVERARSARGPGSGREPGAASGGITVAEAGQAALRGVVELTGKHPEGVTAVQPTEDGWLVGIEFVELQRVLSSADILAIYGAELDADGSLLSFRRWRRYPRGPGRADEGI